MDRLTLTAQCLWAKKSKDGSDLWLPLAVHMTDSASVARKLWNHWVSDGVRKSISAGLQDDVCAEHLFVFLAAVHDLGKATPVFQAKRGGNPRLDSELLARTQQYGLAMQAYSGFQSASQTPHALATQVLLRYAGCNKSIAAILGSHHGKPTDTDEGSDPMAAYPQNFHMGKSGKSAWLSVQQELLACALSLSGYTGISELPRPNMVAQVLLSGLVILVDWIASSEKLFPYISVDYVGTPCAKTRIRDAWAKLSLTQPWHPGANLALDSLFGDRFPKIAAPHALQSAVLQTAAAVQAPGLLVIEAPMGGGKTEAALLAAEIFAAKTRRKGIFFALPTQATSDGVFPRILEWLQNLDGHDAYSLRLMHGKAQFNDAYENLPHSVSFDDEEHRVIAHEWFAGRKKGMLDNFGVGTVDQVLLAALKQKHVMLRHLGLANKVVIIDECHAYDAYMSQYLYMALNWLGAYHVPVIVLSATLPAKQRQALVEAYLNLPPSGDKQPDPLKRGAQKIATLPAWISCTDYPLLTYTEGKEVKQVAVSSDVINKTVSIEMLSDTMLLDKLEDLLVDGGCAGVIVNTVDRAQKLAKDLCGRFGRETVRLLHSRFLAPDRARMEQELLTELGKSISDDNRPHRRIVVGTQVLEQSLDIDFDVLFTDHCPMDLLLQRIGRLHRHSRIRPLKMAHAMCLLMGLDGDRFDPGGEAIYGGYLLMRTKAFLPPRLTLSEDISRLVQVVYGDESAPLSHSPEYSKAQAKHKQLIEDKEKRAKDFRLTRPWPEASLIGWLKTPASGRNEKNGEAAVRDSDETIEVILVHRKADGQIYFLPWVENGQLVLQYEPPAWQTARALARCKVRLPAVLCAAWNLDNTIKALEQTNAAELKEWQKSPWLSGELFVVLDDSLSASLCGHKLVYDQFLGLSHSKEE